MFELRTGRHPGERYLGLVRLSVSLLIPSLLLAQTSLEFSTFHGGDFGDAAQAVAFDSEGNIYATGLSRDLQATPGALSDVRSTEFNVFVVKFDPTAFEVVFNAVFGGSGRDRGTSIAVDAEGAIYIGGVTFSEDFPTTEGAAQTTFGEAVGTGSSRNSNLTAQSLCTQPSLEEAAWRTSTRSSSRKQERLLSEDAPARRICSSQPMRSRPPLHRR